MSLLDSLFSPGPWPVELERGFAGLGRVEQAAQVVGGGVAVAELPGLAGELPLQELHHLRVLEHHVLHEILLG